MPANAFGACAGGICSFVCAAGFADCNRSASDGCEVNTQSSVSNCGACGTVCSLANATPVCAAGVCRVGSCNAGFADCDRNPANGCEVNLNTNASHCGRCGNACPGGGACTAGACGLRCNSGTRRVLVIGSSLSQVTPHLPAGATATLVTDAQWRAMTAAQFATYHLILLPEASSAANYQTTVDTRNTWVPQVTGRIALTGLHMMSHTQGATVFRATLAWLLSGPGTALYVDGLFGGTFRGYSQLVPIGSFSGTGGHSDETVTIVVPSHPTMTGSTSASLSRWGQSVHTRITGYPTATFANVAQVSASASVMVVRSNTCTP
jgi:hypothetical protein